MERPAGEGSPAHLRNKLLEIWHDRMIPAGGNWDRHVATPMESADIIILMISLNFVASTYCYDIEMKRALERHKTHEAMLIPIWLSECVWPAELTPVQHIPCEAPIVKRRNRDREFIQVAEQIAGVAKHIQKGNQ